MKWRWDQGRLEYFQFGEIQRIARGLAAFNGLAIPRRAEPDLLRITLEQFSDRPFLPNHYMVWRNYKRVFGCQLLAVDLSGTLHTTELCNKVSSGALTADEYLLHVATRFSYPSPVFEDYAPIQNPVYPICATIKYLVSEFITSAKPLVSLDEVIDKVKGNGLTGEEPLAAYANLKLTGKGIHNADDEYRQIRELIRFTSQFTFLKWDNPYLILDVGTLEEAHAIALLMKPKSSQHDARAAYELLALGSGVDTDSTHELGGGRGINAFDQEFAEGSKQRVTHLRVERSRKLLDLYFSYMDDPHKCNMCNSNTLKQYPWVSRLVELHHLLPLSSPIRVEKDSTSLKDLVGLCPSCHRATHKFYSSWLKSNNQRDFASREEAHAVYRLATEGFTSRWQL